MLLAESLSEQVIGLTIEVPGNTGPSLLEAIYEQCLCVEQRRAGVAFARQFPIPMLCK
jgi:GxxExxY protein